MKTEPGFTKKTPEELVPKLRIALLDATAHLAGAISAYEQFVGRVDKRGRRDALFKTRYDDFEKALERARKALEELNT